MQNRPPDDQPVTTGAGPHDAVHRPETDGPVGLAPDPDQIAGRALLATALAPSMFPAGKGELLERAQAEISDPVLLGRLRQLPEGRHYDNVNEVWVALGGEMEGAHTGHRQDDSLET